jgi:hypothetical protein
MMFGGPGFGGGFIVGFASGFVSRELAVIAMAVVKPVTKSVIKAGVMTVEKTKESLAYLKESFDDMIAEVREGMEMQEPKEVAAGEDETKKSELPRHERGEHKSEMTKTKQQHKGLAT